VGFVVDKVVLAWVFSKYFGFPPANLHSTKFSIMMITWGRYNRAITDHRAELTQLDSTPH
jgi:hypothetical protein